MEPDTKNRRAQLELRALLDISYGRERALLTALNALMWLSEGAAFAPDRQAEAASAMSAARDAIDAAARSATPNHGLLLGYLTLTAEHEALRAHTNTLTDLLRTASEELARVRVEIESASAQRDEAVAVARKLAEVMGNPEMAQRIADAVHQLTQARRS